MSKKLFKKVLLLLFAAAIIGFVVPVSLYSWGAYAHKKINRMAVFTLPNQMIGFFKGHLEYLTMHSVDPDNRKSYDPQEAARHYIDIDIYGANPYDVVPRKWKDAVAKFTEDTLNEYGICPWHCEKMYFRLIQAFKDKDVDKILYTAANMGHYIGDNCTPLHNTQYYNGKTPDQRGIHAFMETRIPEMFGEDYDFIVGTAEYLEKPLDRVWDAQKATHLAIDTIYAVEEKMSKEFPSDAKYSFENRGYTTVKVYSREYTQQFNALLSGMVERQMKIAVKLLGSMWYTAWVNAGQPDLSKLENKEITRAHKRKLKKQEKMWKTGKVKLKDKDKD